MNVPAPDHERPSKWVVARFGAYMHYAMPRMLHRAGLLERFYTDIYAGRSWARLRHLLPQQWQPDLLRSLFGRSTAELPDDLVHSFPLLGFEYFLQRTFAKNWESVSAVHLQAGREFGKRVVRAGFGDAGGVFAYNTAALEILKAARSRGLIAAMEQCIAPRFYEEELLAEEQRRYPGWDGPRQQGPSTAAAIEREADEWAQADVILCGSEFVRKGIAHCGGPLDRCVVVPYGVDAKFSPVMRDAHDGPLRVLAVGEAGLRKGVTYASEVAKMLKGVAELRWVGPVSLRTEARRKVSAHLDLTGAVPRSQIHQYYDWADVFFLPSVCEGSATVTYEALMSGLPVVTTPNAGSVVEDGVNGFVVAVRDVDAMANRLAQLHEDRALLGQMASAAAKSTAMTSLDAFQKRVLTALGTAMARKSPV